MTNAEPGSSIPAARNDTLDQVIGANVHSLIWAAKETQTKIAPLWGMTQSALSLKLRGARPWYATEIDSAAEHFGVSIDVLFGRAPLPVPGGAVSGWAPSDSNRRPAD